MFKRFFEFISRFFSNAKTNALGVKKDTVHKHTPRVIEAKEATCTEMGLTEEYYASMAG